MVEETKIYSDYSDDEEEEREEDSLERQRDFMEEGPPTKEKEDLYSLFRWIIAKEDSSKVGNLDKTELGLLNISVRDCQKIHLLALTLKHLGFAKFFKAQGEITLATSASKKGWLPELFVTTQKRTTKAREIAMQNLPPSEPKKKGLFGRRR